jgi:hypothetical protein
MDNWDWTPNEPGLDDDWRGALDARAAAFPGLQATARTLYAAYVAGLGPLGAGLPPWQDLIDRQQYAWRCVSDPGLKPSACRWHAASPVPKDRPGNTRNHRRTDKRPSSCHKDRRTANAFELYKQVWRHNTTRLTVNLSRRRLPLARTDSVSR